MSSRSASSNEDLRVMELPGAKDSGDESTKRDLVVPEPYTPLIRRLSSLELKGKSVSVKQEDGEPPHTFIRDGRLSLSSSCF